MYKHNKCIHKDKGTAYIYYRKVISFIYRKYLLYK